MNSLLKKLKKHWIAVWLVAAAVSFSVIIVFAIYTRVTVVKRVVSTEAGVGSRFSSDYMSNAGMKTTESVLDDSTHASFDIRVFNYAYPKEASFRSEETLYDLTATIGTLNEEDEFTELSGSEKISALAALNYSITYKETNDTFKFGTDSKTSYTFEGCSIPGGSAGEDPFTLVFDKSELGDEAKKYCIKLEAVPVDGELSKIWGYVMVRYSKRASTGWTGRLEKLEDKEYDGFNYYLEGNGKGKLTFRWDPEYVTINEDFLNNPLVSFDGLGGSGTLRELDIPTENGKKKLTVIVDSTVINRYEVQFFKTDPTKNYSNSAVAGYLPDTTDDDWVADQ